MLALTTDNYSMLLVLVPFHIFCVFGLFPFIISQKKFAQQLIKDDIFTRKRVYFISSKNSRVLTTGC